MKIAGDIIGTILDLVEQLLKFFDEAFKQGYLLLFIGGAVLVGILLILLAI